MLLSQFSRKILFLCLTLTIILSSGCDMSERGCRAGDNFEGNDTEFDSFRDDQDTDYRDDNTNQLTTRHGLIKWQHTGLVLNGKNIVVDISGRWTPWGQSTMKKEILKTIDGEQKTILEDVETICKNFPLTNVVAARETLNNVRYIALDNPKSSNLSGGTGYPCWLQEGLGLYLLFRAPSYQSPNANLSVVESPNSGTIHLNRSSSDSSLPGEKDRSRFVLDFKNLEVKDSTGLVFPLEVGMEVYGKINDSYYLDNYGAYTLDFVSGVYKTAKKPLFKTIKEYVVVPVQNVSKKLFLSIVDDRAYKNGIYALLILYIVVTAICYLMGAIQTQLGELTIRIFKIGLVLVLLTPNAWNFFYNNLFKMYLQGIDQMISIIVNKNNMDDPNNSMDFMDRITEKITNPILANRLAAALSANLIMGVFYMIFFSLILLFFFVCVTWSFAIYIQGMILLSITTAMFPIFLAMILFNFTKPLFQEYIDAILGYSFQIVMTFVILFFMAEMIQFEIQRALGFKICVAPVMNFNPFSTPGPDVMERYKQDAQGNDLLDSGGKPQTNSNVLLVKNWVPGEGSKYKTIPAFSSFVPFYQIYSAFELLVSKRHSFNFDIEKIAIPPDYKIKRYRYKSLPFMETDAKLADDVVPLGYRNCFILQTRKACHPDLVFPGGRGQHDHTRIKNMMFSDNSYKFFHIGDLFIIVIFMFILWELNIHFGPNIAKWIALSGKGYSMPQALLGNSIISAYAKYQQAIQNWTQSSNSFIKYASGFAALLTTDQSFFVKKIAFKSIGRIADLGQEKAMGFFGDITGVSAIMGLGSNLPQNNFTRFASQIGSAITDSILYDNLESRSIAAQAKDAELDRENMLGFRRVQDKIGGLIDYDKAIFDKWGASSLANGLNPLDNPLDRIIGQSDTHLFRSLINFDLSMSTETKPGIISELANAIAGDKINEKFENKFGEKIFKHDTTLENAFGSLFTANADKMHGMYNKAADFDYEHYKKAIDQEYQNSLDTIDTKGKTEETNTITPVTNTSSAGPVTATSDGSTVEGSASVISPDGISVVSPSSETVSSPLVEGSAATLSDLPINPNLYSPNEIRAIEIPQQTEIQRDAITEMQENPSISYKANATPPPTDEIKVNKQFEPDEASEPNYEASKPDSREDSDKQEETIPQKNQTNHQPTLDDSKPTLDDSKTISDDSKPTLNDDKPVLNDNNNTPESVYSTQASVPETLQEVPEIDRQPIFESSQSSLSKPSNITPEVVAQEPLSFQDTSKIDNTPAEPEPLKSEDSKPDSSKVDSTKSTKPTAPPSEQTSDKLEIPDREDTKIRKNSLTEKSSENEITIEMQEKINDLQAQIDKLQGELTDSNNPRMDDARYMEKTESDLKSLKEKLNILMNK